MTLNKQDLMQLAVDTSCDETSAAVMINNKVISNILLSQEEIHRKWGGVVPILAKRHHAAHIDSVIAEAIKRASSYLGKKFQFEDFDFFSVTYGPGLAIALEVGVQKSKEIALKYKKPLVAVNHMEGHLLSSLAANRSGKASLDYKVAEYPMMGVITSGKHTDIIIVNEIGNYEIIAQTLDDAIGEAYDKVARMLGISYPGGPILTEFAKKGNSERFDLPIPLEKDARIAFSYSGLKTAVLYTLKELNQQKTDLSSKDIYDMAASFEKSALKHLQQKVKKAVKKYQPKAILLGGGVVASAKLRSSMRKIAKKHQIPLYFPYSDKLFMDNAAMIGVAGYFKYKRGEVVHNIEKLDRNPRAKITDKLDV
jgi:N6-L-threonylcarbamoyladenine synthase